MNIFTKTTHRVFSGSLTLALLFLLTLTACDTMAPDTHFETPSSPPFGASEASFTVIGDSTILLRNHGLGAMDRFSTTLVVGQETPPVAFSANLRGRGTQIYGYNDSLGVWVIGHGGRAYGATTQRSRSVPGTEVCGQFPPFVGRYRVEVRQGDSSLFDKTVQAGTCLVLPQTQLAVEAVGAAQPVDSAMPDLYLAAQAQGDGMSIHIRVRPLGTPPGPMSLQRATIQTTGSFWLDDFSSFYLDDFSSFYLDDFSSFYLDDFAS